MWDTLLSFFPHKNSRDNVVGTHNPSNNPHSFTLQGHVVGYNYSMLLEVLFIWKTFNLEAGIHINLRLVTWGCTLLACAKV